jgi:hypothetical protein
MPEEKAAAQPKHLGAANWRDVDQARAVICLPSQRAVYTRQYGTARLGVARGRDKTVRLV